MSKRIIYELCELACLPLELMGLHSKGCETRSFSHRITGRELLE